MTKFEKLNIYALSVSMAASPLVAIGTGPTAIAPIRLVASVLLVLSVSLRILTFIITYRKLWSFASYSILNLLWLVFSVYLPARDISSTHYEITELFTVLNFSLVPLSTILLASNCLFNDIINEKNIFKFILPSMIVFPALLLTSSYLAYSWASLTFLFAPPVYFLLYLPSVVNRSIHVKLRSYILITSTLLILGIVTNFAIVNMSRTFIVSSIYCITILFLSLLFSGKFDKKKALVISPLLISIFVFYVSSSELIDSFNAKNVAVQNVVVSYDYGFVGSVLNSLSLGDNRAFIWYDLFSRKFFTLLFGDPGATLFSVMHGGFERSGVEGFFANLIIDYGFISTALLCFFLALVLARSVRFLLINKPTRYRLKTSESINNLYIGWFPLLVLVPLVIQGLTFYNPSSSLAFVYMFSCISYFLLRRSWKPARR